MILGTSSGTTVAEVRIPVGEYVIGPKPTSAGVYNGLPGTDISTLIIRHGSLSETEKSRVIDKIVQHGASRDFTGVLDFSYFWAGFTEIVSMTPPDTSNAVSLSHAWDGCSSMITFPMINSSQAVDVSYAWANMPSLLSFPTIS